MRTAGNAASCPLAVYGCQQPYENKKLSYSADQSTTTWSYNATSPVNLRNIRTNLILCNMLPPHLKNSSVSREQFKSGLKTWLFVQAYS